MKNANKVRYNVSKVLEFERAIDLVYFVMKYRDLFKPYSEEMASALDRYDSETNASLAREFGIRSWYDESANLVYVNFKTKEAFKEVEHLFRKEHLRRGTNKYVYKSAE